MAKQTESGIMGIIIWLVGILVSLAVGSGMIDKTLTIPGIPEIITIVAGWIVVVGAIIGALVAIFNK